MMNKKTDVVTVILELMTHVLHTERHYDKRCQPIPVASE